MNYTKEKLEQLYQEDERIKFLFFWGIGLSVDSEAASVPMNWRGLNLLGFALMEVRDLLNQ